MDSMDSYVIPLKPFSPFQFLSSPFSSFPAF